jgi:hypothetical protein
MLLSWTRLSLLSASIHSVSDDSGIYHSAEVDSRVNSELLEYVPEVRMGSVRRDKQLLSDLPIRTSFSSEPSHCGFSLG